MKNKMKTKDLIYAGAFGAIYLIVVMIVTSALGVIPLLYVISPFFVGILCGTIYLLYVSKVQKPGAVLLLSILFGFLAGSTYWVSFVFIIITGLAAEIVVKIGQYKSLKMYSLAYCIFNLNMIGPFLFITFAREEYLSMAKEYYGAEHAAALSAVTPPWINLAQAALAVTGAIIGIIIARHLVKKHYEKAGIL